MELHLVCVPPDRRGEVRVRRLCKSAVPTCPIPPRVSNPVRVPSRGWCGRVSPLCLRTEAISPHISAVPQCLRTEATNLGAGEGGVVQSTQSTA